MNYYLMSKHRLVALLRTRAPYVKYPYAMKKEELIEILQRYDKTAELSVCDNCRSKYVKMKHEEEFPPLAIHAGSMTGTNDEIEVGSPSVPSPFA